MSGYGNRGTTNGLPSWQTPQAMYGGRPITSVNTDDRLRMNPSSINALQAQGRGQGSGVNWLALQQQPMPAISAEELRSLDTNLAMAGQPIVDMNPSAVRMGNAAQWNPGIQAALRTGGLYGLLAQQPGFNQMPVTGGPEAYVRGG